MGRRRRKWKEGKEESLKERLSPTGLKERVRRERGRRRLMEEAERVVMEEAKLEEKEREGEWGGMTRQGRRRMERERKKLEARKLRLLERDDEGVLEILKGERRIDNIVEGGEPTEVDEVMWFLVKELKLVKAFEALAPAEKYFDEETGREVKRRRMYPAFVLNVLGVLSRYMGLSSGPEVQARLLTDGRWMGLLGFREEEVLYGATRRSESLRGKTRRGRGGEFEEAGPMGPARAREGGPRGALSSQTLAEHESSLDGRALEEFFNGVVRAMVRVGLIPKEVRGALDTTTQEVVETFEGAGEVRKKVKVASRVRRPRQVSVKVRGFKVWYLMDVETGLPLGFAFDTIEKSDNEHAKAVIDQARANLRGYGRLVEVTLDRGFLDGDLLWWLKEERGIHWVCPSKEKMDVTEEARGRVWQVLGRQKEGTEAEIETAQRLAASGKAYDGVKFFEQVRADNRQSLVVAQVDDLRSTDFYGPGGSSSSRVNSKKFRPTPLHATVVLRWPDRSSKDVEDAREHDEESKGPVVLLSPEPERALVRYDHYDDRSLIENRLHREGKQYFGLGEALARNRAAQMSATVFSTVALMLYRGLELHRQKALEAFDQRAERLGVLRYRRQRMLQTRGTVIVIIGQRYARVTMYELMRLLGVEVLRAPLPR
jgi:hypothetical protein